MSRVTTWRYHLPSVKGEGWVVAFLDSIGCFSVLSDYGDYGHRWPENGWGPGDFRQFFARLEPDYVLRKIARRDHYDGAATLREVKARICELRRGGGSWTRDRAREEWDLLGRFDRLYSQTDFAFWYERTQIDEASELAFFDFGPQAHGFMTHAFPLLQAAIRAELETARQPEGDHPCPT